MNKAIRLGAAVGALALLGSFAGVTSANATPIPFVKAADPQQGPEFTFQVDGCSVDEGAAEIKYQIWTEGDVVVPLEHNTVAAPATGAATINEVISHPGDVTIKVQCTYTANGEAEAELSAVTVQRGVLDLAGVETDTWLEGSEVVVSVPLIEFDDNVLTPFDPDSQVKLEVKAPNGEISTFDLRATAEGYLDAKLVLPYGQDGAYEVLATGTRNGAPAVFFNKYSSVAKKADDSTPGTVNPGTMNPGTADPGVAPKPTKLPKTGN
ncbi:hypothetical protein HMPREF1531_00193 [Propionibacterium sp. oral taxon 192 str. F0372]|uniref:hypothetical protein n=1 Tax=Propionibacterium sp. oral taxon 192 TaxID=671222 RepID=UPI000353FF7C|nr:hypothetical protein [Propionibacterium sp. oral taxon 192]EPH07144.1 hypothetical protein HMPREF1531_00193 [Propionibacterium sp. oral taxon 192 str. F0372]